MQAPTPSGHPLLGQLPEFRRGRHAAMTRWHRDCGDVVRFRFGPKQFHLISHPAVIEDVLINRPDVFTKMYQAGEPRGLALVLGQGLVTSTGALWQRQRRLLQPLFVRSRSADYLADIVAAGEHLCRRWRANAPDVPVEIGTAMMQTTLEVICRTMFGTTLDEPLEPLSEAFMTGLDHAAHDVQSPLRIPQWLPTARNRRFKSALGYLDGLVYRMIAARRAGDDGRDDLLNRLIGARDPETGEPMSDRQIRDEVLTIFAAGHETTAVALTWTLWLLAGHPDVADRLAAEAAAVLGDRTPTADDLGRLEWTRAVVEESLRLYPPAAMLIRRAVSATELAGYAIPARSLVVLSIANVHRHPACWDAPAEFRPERFLSGAAKPAHRLAYMPFGAGHRLCIGNHFALTEAVSLLALIAREFRFERRNDPPVEPEIAVTLRPKHGLRLNVHRRVGHAPLAS